MSLEEQLVPQQWRHSGTPAEVSGLKGSSTHCPAVGRGCSPLRGGDGCPSAPTAGPRFPFPPPLSCCSLTQAGAEGERHLQLHCCLLAPEPLPESKSFSKKTLNSFNRQLELLPHRSKGHELSVFIALGRFMSLFFKEGRERGEAVAYYLAWGAGREARGEDEGRHLQWKCTTSQRAGLCFGQCSQAWWRAKAGSHASEDQAAAEAQSVWQVGSSSLPPRLPAQRCQLERTTWTRRACCCPASLTPTDGTRSGALLKSRAGGTGLLQSQPSCPGCSFQSEEAGRRLAGSHTWIPTPEQSPMHVCSNRPAVLPSSPRSSSVHLPPSCQRTQHSLPAPQQVQ